MSTVTQTRTTISVEALQDMLSRGEPVTVLDVRSMEDRQEWSIPGSLHVDAYDALRDGDAAALDDLELPFDNPVVTVCNAGITSRIAMERLLERGIDAWSLEGGMRAWSLAWNIAELALPGSQATVIQVRRTGKGCLSYLIGNAGKAAAIDATLGPEVYFDLASEYGWTITRVIDTHLHADHISTSRALAAMTGATLYLPTRYRSTFRYAALYDGDTVSIGGAILRAIATPGHTLESMSYFLDGQALFTGDTLFLNAVGRPDLEANAEEARLRAHKLYDSLHRLMRRPRETIVLPGHTDKPVPFDEVPIARSLGEVVSRIESLWLSEDDFVSHLLARIPQTPPNHSRIVSLNAAGATPDGARVALEAGANRCAIG
jgi:glyoxylase-like metal-dependent hydrolase (beta-lactamase superfamily II)/rhodanese-related sulfurtransferase